MGADETGNMTDSRITSQVSSGRARNMALLIVGWRADWTPIGALTSCFL